MAFSFYHHPLLKMQQELMMCRDRREIQTPPLPQRNVLKSSSLMHRILLACVVFDSLHLIVLVHPTNNFLHLFSSFGTA